MIAPIWMPIVHLLIAADPGKVVVKNVVALGARPPVIPEPPHRVAAAVAVVL